MTITELNDYIFHYLRSDKTQTAVMLTGAWGSGKTFYIENELIPFLKEKGASCVVVSLYGLDDVAAISKSIYMELRLPTFSAKSSESITTGKVIAKNVVKGIVGKIGIDVSLTQDELQKLYDSVDLKDKLIVLEDIERSNISVLALLGYVNGLVERDGVKILLVANEDEILKKETEKIKFDFTPIRYEKEKKGREEPQIPEETAQYLRIKEKTVNDTIQFSMDYRQAVGSIVNDFPILSSFIDTETISNLSDLVKGVCKRNLRILIYALQKTSDIIEQLGEKEFEKDFYNSILKGIVYLSANIKTGEFPRWEGTQYLSTKLGTNNVPVMKFAYDFIRWQTFDEEEVGYTYEEYKSFQFFSENAEYSDPDVRMLGNYAEETEEHVLQALKNVEKKLENPDAIGINAYCKLVYYLIYVGSVVGFDSHNSCELLLRNARGIGKTTRMDAQFYFASTHKIEDEKLKNKYESFIAELKKAIEYEPDEIDFSYDPHILSEIYTDICRNTGKYTKGHRFISKFVQEKLENMLLMCTSAQINDFRGIMFAVYRHATKNEFDERDVIAMEQLLEWAKQSLNEDNQWDKIQQMQINWLCMNLEQFISQMQ